MALKIITEWFSPEEKIPEFEYRNSNEEFVHILVYSHGFFGAAMYSSRTGWTHQGVLKAINLNEPELWSYEPNLDFDQTVTTSEKVRYETQKNTSR